MPISHQALLAAIDEARENSYGTDEQSSLGLRRAKALDSYLGLNTNPAPEGRSQVVDRTTYQTIHTILPSLVRIFAGSSDEVCKFVPVGPEDEQGADQTTAAVSHIVTQLNPWEQIVTDWIHDSSLLCNGYAMAYWDESTEKVQERYLGQSQDQVAALMQDDDVKVLEHTQHSDEFGNQMALQQWQQMAQQAQAQGQQPPPKPQPQTLHDLVIERSRNKGKVCLKVLPPEHCTVSAATPNWMLTDCPFFEYREKKTIAELRDMGLDVPLDISDDEDDDTEEDLSRDRFNEDSEADEGKGQLREVWARMTWVRADAEGDKQVRLYYCIVVGKTVLFSEQCNRIPVSSMTPQPLPHRHIGMSIAETVTDIQDTKQAIKRGALDNLYLANNGRHIVSSRVNIDDFLDARPGGVVRMLDDALPGEGHVLPLTHPFAFDSIIGSLEYFDSDAQNRTGANRYFAGTDAGAINKTAAGVSMLTNSASMRVEHIARMMAPAVEELFSIVHEIMSKHQLKPLVMKLRGNWITVDPQAWRTKRDVRISVGVGAGQKESMMAQLQMVLGAQMQIGLPLGLVTRENIQATNAEILKLAGFANVEKFWPDPSRLPPQQQQPSPEQIKAQTEMQKLQFQAQQDQQKFQAEQQVEQQRMQLQAQVDSQREEMQARQKMLEAQQKAQLEQQKAEIDAQSEAMRLQFEKWKAELDAAVKLQIAGMSQQQAQMQADSAAQAKQGSDNGIQQVIASIQALQEAMDAPTEIVRGPDGRAIGVKRGGKVRQINRGPDGRAIGVQ